MSTATKAPETEVANLEERFVSEIDAELDKLRAAKEEFDKLTEMRARITGPLRVNGRATSAGRAQRTRQGGRQEQLVQLVHESPDGITISELADKMGGVKTNYLYRVRDKAKTANQVREEGGKLFPVSAS